MKGGISVGSTFTTCASNGRVVRIKRFCRPFALSVLYDACSLHFRRSPKVILTLAGNEQVKASCACGKGRCCTSKNFFASDSLNGIGGVSRKCTVSNHLICHPMGRRKGLLRVNTTIICHAPSDTLPKSRSRGAFVCGSPKMDAVSGQGLVCTGMSRTGCRLGRKIRLVVTRREFFLRKRCVQAVIGHRRGFAGCTKRNKCIRYS